MFIKRLLVSILLFFSIISLNCGGGGNSSNTQRPENPENPPVEPKKFSVVKGFVYIGEGTNSYPDNLVSIVKVISIDKNGNEIDKKNILTKNGYFSINTALSSAGGSIVIIVNADGYTPGTKTIKYSSPDDFNDLNIPIRIDPVIKKIIPLNKIKVSSSKEQTVKISFYKNKWKEIYTSNYSLDPLEFSLAIPLKKLKRETEDILVEYKGYRPSNPKDYQNFPGEYTDNDRELISVGFFSLDIKDPKTGKNPFNRNISPQLVKNKGEYYRLLSFVDCKHLLKIKHLLGTLDEDPKKEGIQITFYVFNPDKGKWVKAGVGTFVKNQNVNYEKFGENLDIIDTPWDYILFNGCIKDIPCSTINSDSKACIDIDGDNVVEDVSCEGNFVITDENAICTDINPIYVVVSVTSPEFQWKNIDYVKPFHEEMKISITVIVNDDEGNPLSVPVYLVPANPANPCVETVSGYTSAKDGRVNLETFKYCDNNGAYIEYLNPFTNNYERYPSTPLSISDGQIIKIILSNPLKCKIIGKVEDTDGNPQEGIHVYLNTDSLRFYKETFTDRTGEYFFKVPCQVPLNIFISPNENNPLHANVNGSLEENEDNDDGKIVYLKPYKIGNSPPDGFAYLSTYSTKWGSVIDANILAWDYENDVPIRYKLKFVNQDNDVIKSYVGQIDSNYGNTTISIDTKNFPKSAASYKIFLILVDNGFKGNINLLSQAYTKKYVGALNVLPPDINTPPTIVYFYVSPTTVSKVGSTVRLLGNGYDIDGDPVYSKVYYRCFDNNGIVVDSGYTPNGENVYSLGYEDFSIPNNSKINKCEFIWELSDGKDTVYSEPAYVEVKNTPPSVYIWTKNNNVSIEEKKVKIFAIVSDPDNDKLTCNWYINNILDNQQHSCSEYILNLSRFKPESDIQIKLEVTDGINTSSDTLVIHYGQLGDLNIIIQ